MLVRSNSNDFSVIPLSPSDQERVAVTSADVRLMQCVVSLSRMHWDHGPLAFKKPGERPPSPHRMGRGIKGEGFMDRGNSCPKLFALILLPNRPYFPFLPDQPIESKSP